MTTSEPNKEQPNPTEESGVLGGNDARVRVNGKYLNGVSFPPKSFASFWIQKEEPYRLEVTKTEVKLTAFNEDLLPISLYCWIPD